MKCANCKHQKSYHYETGECFGSYCDCPGFSEDNPNDNPTDNPTAWRADARSKHHIQPQDDIDTLEWLIREYPQRGDTSESLLYTWELLLRILKRLGPVENKAYENT